MRSWSLAGAAGPPPPSATVAELSGGHTCPRKACDTEGDWEQTCSLSTKPSVLIKGMALITFS